MRVNDDQNEQVRKIVTDFMQSGAFTKRKITDTPSEALSLVNRKYVTNNGTVRPTSSVVGQPFLDMTLAAGNGRPIWWNGTGWIDADGSYV